MFGKPKEKTRKSLWVFSLDEVYNPQTHVLTISHHLGIPIKDTMRLAVGISDVLMATADILPDLRPELKEYAESYYGELINDVIAKYYVKEDIPDDLEAVYYENCKNYRSEIVELAISIMGVVPPNTKEVIYQCQIENHTHMFRIRQSLEEDALDSLREEVGASKLTRNT